MSETERQAAPEADGHRLAGTPELMQTDSTFRTIQASREKLVVDRTSGEAPLFGVQRQRARG
jgi:hypothetical protein